MCGIAGVVGRIDPEHIADPREAVERMATTLRHRGPDDGGLATLDVHGGVGAFGHRRLAILDPSEAGHQPMTRDGCTIVYNGEIYNFHELRASLPGPFHSNSDTEVLLALYLRDGPACVEHLVGMFAFAIWDARKQRLFAARDRLGIKPLIYRELPGGGLAFASEIKALLDLGRPSLDRSALRDFFTYKYIPTPKTIYEGIHKLPPAHTLVYDDGALTLERYWQPESSTSIRDPEQAFDQFSTLLQSVVDDHLLSDVPVGVFFSGGIDSTAVAASVDRPRTFTLGFDAKSHDESAIAARIAEHLGTRHRMQRATGAGLEESLDAMPGLYDEPFGDHGSWAMRMIAGVAVEDVKVALTGEGGDELFAGYHWYDKLTRFRPSPGWRFAARFLPTLSTVGRSAERRGASGLERYAMFLGPFTLRQKHALLNPELMHEDYDDLWFFRQHWRPELTPLKRIQWLDLHTYLPDDMLTKVDRATMAVSLEARPPFVDHRMVSFALALDDKLLHQDGQGKLLSRQYLTPRLPEGVLDRPKIGFSMPVRRWAKRNPALLDAALHRLKDAGILRSARSRSWTNEQVWSLLVLDSFLQRQSA